MGKNSKLPDSAEGLAQQLHCLTCLLVEAVERADTHEIQALFSQRGLVLHLLESERPTPEAREWIRRTSELEVSTLATWKASQNLFAAELQLAGQTRKNLNQYRRQLETY